MSYFKRLIFFLILLILCNQSLTYCSGYSVKFVKALTKDDLGKKILSPIFLKFDLFTNTLYLIDAPKSRIIFYNENFFPYFSVGIGRGIKKPIALAFSKNEIYVCEQKQLYSNPKISVFSNGWRKKREITLHGFDNSKNFYPQRIAVNDKGNIYVVSTSTTGIFIFTNKGKFLKKIEIKDSFYKDEKPFKIKFSDILIDKNQRIYALSEQIGKLYVFSKYNILLFKIGKKGGTKGKLSRPRGVAVDVNQKKIYIVDYMRQIVQCFDYEKGKFLLEFGGYGISYGYFNYPTSISVDNNGYIYVSDMFNSRIQVFKLNKNSH